jgi:transcriptional regulator with XRE-family HTH domain
LKVGVKMGIELRLKHLRKDRGYTQESFAEKLGVPVGTYRNWEQGINTPDSETIIRIVQLLETSSDYLLGRVDYDMPNVPNLQGGLMTIGDRIRKSREYKEMPMEELGKRTGVTRQTIFKYETGIISNIPSDKIEKMADALEVTPTYLIGWEDERGAPTEDFADRIKQYREEKELSLEDLAKRLNTYKQVVHRWETRQQIPQMDKVAEVAELLGVSVPWLIGYDVEIAKTEPKRRFLMDKIAKADEKKLNKIVRLMELIDDEEDRT